jgi:hypothetical protein
MKKQKEEVDALIWCSYKKAQKMLTHEGDRGVLNKARNYLIINRALNIARGFDATCHPVENIP